MAYRSIIKLDTLTEISSESILANPSGSTGQVTEVGLGLYLEFDGSNNLAVNIPTFSGAGTTGLVPDPVTSTGLFLSDNGTYLAAQTPLSFLDEGSLIAGPNVVSQIDFVGATVTASESTGTLTVTVDSENRFTDQRTVTASTDSVLTTDFIVLLDTSSNNIDLTLPASPSVGDRYIIKKSALANDANVIPNGTDNLENVNASYMLCDLDSITVVYTGSSGWYII